MKVIEIIQRLEELEPDIKIRMFDSFGQIFTPLPSVDSWRGSYDMPAVVVKPIRNLKDCITAEDFITALKYCDGLEVSGWKGGHFILSEDSTLFLVSEWGSAGNSTTISKILSDGYCYIQEDAEY